LYQKLKNIEKEFPSTAVEYSTTRVLKPNGTCNPTCSDIGFESGNLTGWNAYYATNNSTTTTMSYTSAVGGAAGAVTKAAYDIVNCTDHTQPTYQVAIMSGTGNDPIAGSIIPVVAPGGGSYSCRIGDTSVGGARVAVINQQFTVTAGNTALNYMYAPVIDLVAATAQQHPWGQQPHFVVTITDVTTGDTLQCGKYLVTSQTTGAGYIPISYKIPTYGWTDTVLVAPWKTVFVSLQNYIGHCIQIEASVADCFPNGHIGPHFCYCYFDATCGPFSIIASTPSVCGGNVSLTAPAGGSAYAWTGPGIVGSNSGQVITAGASGTYTVTVTSADGCTDTLQKPVTITPTMSVTATSTNAGCATGTATANPTGGTPPYSYNWSNGSTNQ
ncbi:MAG TPA: SprB repeat-containing protein, partial [Bacteroidia bacterium]|nr:SprB repeat-containing protein [Bacteroidia bacterium]